MPWPDQYMSAKFAAYRQFERDRMAIEELREAAKPEGEQSGRRSFVSHSAQARAAEWEMQGAAVGAAAASQPDDEAAE